MTKHDKILIGIVLIFSLLGYLIFCIVNQDASSLLAEISVNGSVITKIDLNNPPSDRIINIPGPLGNSIIEVKPGAIRMKFSPCPDHHCMNTGWINRSGQVIACIPNRVIIKLLADKNPVDAISH